MPTPTMPRAGFPLRRYTTPIFQHAAHKYMDGGAGGVAVGLENAVGQLGGGVEEQTHAQHAQAGPRQAAAPGHTRPAEP